MVSSSLPATINYQKKKEYNFVNFIFVKENRGFSKKLMKKIYFEYLLYLSLVALIIIIAIWNALKIFQIFLEFLNIFIQSVLSVNLLLKLKKNKFSTYIMTSYVMLLYFVIGIGNTATENTLILGF